MKIEKFQALLEKTWAQHDPAILRNAKQIEELKQQLSSRDELLKEMAWALSRMYRNDYEIGEDPQTIRDRVLAKYEELKK